ncbi:MAG: PQQ-binding-like beta-propeller repeat protein, partial [Acidobacteriota bacterium]
MKTHSSQRFPTSTLVLVTLCIVLGVATSAAGSWTQWGGPARDFSPQASPRLADWGEHGPRVLWLRPLGPGYSGLVTAGPRLITMTRDGADEVLVALDPDTGETLWRDAYAAPTGLLAAVDKSYGDAPQATPLVADGRVIGLGFTGVLTSAAVADGSVVWRHDLLHELQASVPYFGHAASPIRVDDTVVVFAGG